MVEDIPVDAAFHDVTVSKSGVFAVGEDGLVVRRQRTWEPVEKEFDGGNTLYGTSATDDGKRVWFAGGSGAAGYFDADAEETVEYEITADEHDYRSVAVSGPADQEVVWAVDDNGTIYHGSPTGEEEAAWEWEQDMPGSDASFTDIKYAPGVPVATAEDGTAFVHTDDGWQDLGVGAVDALTSVAATGDGPFFGSDEYVYAPTEDGWTAEHVAEDTVTNLGSRGDQVFATTGDGDLLHRTNGDWSTVDVDVDVALNAVVARDHVVAVGDEGTIVEH